MLSLFDLSGRTAVVTGGNSGIGLGLATALGGAGAEVILLARRPVELSTAVDQLRENGIKARGLTCDLSDHADLESACEKISANHRVDILVNAAGINLRQPFEEVTPQAFDQHMSVHLRAPFFLTQKLTPSMRENGWGRILNIASLQSYRAFPNSAPYGAAKGGIVQLTRAIAEAYSKDGITCNAIGPGFFHTPLTQPVFGNDELKAQMAARTAIGRNGEMQDLSGAAIFFCSDASAYITGQTLFIDGGFTAK